MVNIRATEIRKGMVIKIDGELFQVLKYEHLTPGNKRAINQLQLRGLKSGASKPLRLPSGATVESAYLDKRPCTFLYQDPQGAHFMDSETYEQFTLSLDQTGDAIHYLTEETAFHITFHEGEAISVDLPASVILEIMEAEEAIRGDTATNVTKNATLSTGLVIKVPNHISVGDKVKVGTENGDFLGRSN